jgi:hypothetical protein
MNEMDTFLELPFTAQAAAVCFVVCATVLFMMLIAAPRRNCFFFRWSPETRFLALIFAPAMLIIWPIVLYWWLIQSSGVDPDELDFYDD